MWIFMEWRYFDNIGTRNNIDNISDRETWKPAKQRGDLVCVIINKKEKMANSELIAEMFQPWALFWQMIIRS